MSGKTLLLDTNIVIYLAKKELRLFDFSKKHDTLGISSISYMECLGYLFTDSDEEFITTKFCNYLELFQLTNEIMHQTIAIRKQHKIKLPDAIIASTAIVQGATLITRNIKDFTAIKKLELIDPYML